MALYNVEVTESLSRVVEQEANSYEEAEELVTAKYDDEEIVLDWNDLSYTNYKPYPSQNLKEDFLLEINFDRDKGNVIIGTDSSSGAKYDCKTIEDLKNAFNNYIESYIELENVKSEDKNMEV